MTLSAFRESLMLFVLYIMCTYHHKCLLRIGCRHSFCQPSLVSLTSLPLTRHASLLKTFDSFTPPLRISFVIISGRNFLKVVDTVTFVIFRTENPTRFNSYSDPYPLYRVIYVTHRISLYTSARNLVFSFHLIINDVS